MGNDFSVYLLYMLLISAFLLVLFFLVRKFKGNRRHAEKEIPVNCGSISVFFDNSRNATIVPYVKDKYGVGRATADICYLKWSYTAEALGNAVRQCMLSCKTGEPCTTEQLMDILGSKGWKEFSQGKRNVSIHYKENSGMVFNATLRMQDGAYHFFQAANKTTLPGDTDNDTLGKTVLALLQSCRC